MILQRLVEYYDRLREGASDPPPQLGFSREKIGFELVVDPNGDAAVLNDLRSSRPVTRPGAGRVEAPWKTVPYRGDRSSNIKPNFLWDNTGYVFGRAGGGAEPKKLEAFRELHRSVLATTEDPQLRAVVRFLEAWDPATYDDLDLADEAMGQNIVFRIRGSRMFVHQAPALVAAWQAFFLEDVENEDGTDLIDGQPDRIASLHFQIQGVADAQPTGAALSSFNASAYTSYGYSSSYNSPVSVRHAFAYATALRELLLYTRRVVQLDGITMTFWAERPTELETFISDLWQDIGVSGKARAPEAVRRVEQVRLFTSQLRRGYGTVEAIDTSDTTGFYLLGLSAPARSRLSVRFWADTTVGELKRQLGQHMSDIELTGAEDGFLSIGGLIRATGRATANTSRGPAYDPKTVPAQLASALSRAVLTGGPYPQSLLTAMLGRIRADGVVSHARVAGIKGCLVRNSRLRGNPLEVPVGLDTTKTDPAYVTGRLFALLEKAQEDSSDSDLNATIKDRYFSSASATPAVVFPRLIRLNAHHLAKLETPKKIFYEKQLGEIMSKIDGFAQHFTLEDQGLFAVGYFHQRQDLFTKKPREGDAS